MSFYGGPSGSSTRTSYSYSISSNKPSSGGYGAPSGGYGAPSGGYGAPSSGYGGSYGAPSGGYSAPSGGYSAPSGGYGAPSGGYGAPSGGYSAPSGGYGAPSGGYSAPSGGYSGSYGAPSGGSYGASAGGYGSAAAKAPSYSSPSSYGGSAGAPAPAAKKAEKQDYYANIGASMYKQSLEASTCSSTFKETIAQCERTGNRFTDGDFPPEWRSLWGHGESLSGVYEEDWEDYAFCSAKEIFPDGYKLWDTIESNDISQGALGDCYFLSSLSAIAEHPERIKKIFVTQEINKHGVIVVRLCPSGIFEEIVIDENFPVCKSDKTPCFTKNVGPELWVMALEKAYSKCFGGYLNIDAGMTTESLWDLTGAPTRFFDPSKDNVEEIWKNLVDGERKEYIMTAGSSTNAGRDQISDIGLVGSHAYALLAAYELIDEYGRKRLSKSEEETKRASRIIRLVKLRNPWGSGTQGEWLGDWSDKDHNWTPELRKELNMSDDDDGIFCMPYETFCEYFDEVVICNYHDNYEYTSKALKMHKSKGKRISFEVQTPGVYFVSLSQKHRKKFPRSSDYEYSQQTCVVGKILGDGKFEYIEGSSRSEKDVWCKCQMTPGKYCVYVRSYWNNCDGPERTAGFSVYGPQKVEIQESNEATVPKEFLNVIYADRGFKELKTKLKPYTQYDEPKISHAYEKTDDGFAYFYYQNDSDSTTLIANLTLKSCKYVKLMAPFNNSSEAKLTVKPGERKVILLKYTDSFFSLNYGETPEFQKSAGNLKTTAKQQGYKAVRHTQSNQDVGIACYMLRHPGGTLYYYENQSSNYALDEQIQFVLRGCHIDGQSGNSVSFSLGPRSDHMVNIVKDSEMFGVQVGNIQSRVRNA